MIESVLQNFTSWSKRNVVDISGKEVDLVRTLFDKQLDLFGILSEVNIKNSAKLLLPCRAMLYAMAQMSTEICLKLFTRISRMKHQYDACS